MASAFNYGNAGASRPREPLAKVTGREASDRTGERLRELKERRQEMEVELNAFAAADDDGVRIEELEREVSEMEAEINRRRGVEKMNKTTNGPAAIRKSAEGLMDRYAESIRREVETHEQAYARACLTDLGRSALKNIDDAYRLQVGQLTSAEIVKAAGAAGLEAAIEKRVADLRCPGEDYHAAYARVVTTDPAARGLYGVHRGAVDAAAARAN